MPVVPGAAEAATRALVAELRSLRSLAQVGLKLERRQVGPEVGPTSAFSSCIPAGVHGPTGIFWANLMPSSPKDDPHIEAIAAKYGRSPAQVLLRWALQHGAAVIPTSRSHSGDNAALFDFALSGDDMATVSGLAWFDALCPIQFWNAKCLKWAIVTRAYVPRQVPGDGRQSTARCRRPWGGAREVRHPATPCTFRGACCRYTHVASV